MIKLPLRAMQRYWRATRGLTLGAQAVVIDGHGRFLLVKHGYRPGWHFPGGGVERGEAVMVAMMRELEEEAGVFVTGPAQLFGIFDNGAKFPGDHVVLYIVRDWAQPRVPTPNAEIRAQGFFAATALPEGIADGAQRRIQEIVTGSAPGSLW